MEDLHQRAGSKRFWEKEHERIDLGTCCLILSCSLWEVRPTYRLWLLSATNKDVLPALQKSNVIYQFSCHYDSRYVGRTSQRLQDRIKQHVPKSIRSCSFSQKRLLPACWCKSSTKTNTQSPASDSAITLHLSQNRTCAQHYDDRRSSILAKGRSPFHLSALEATFIKTSNPALCWQKEFVYRLRLCTNDALSSVFFQSITARLFPSNSRSFSCALHSDDSSWQVSDEKLRRYERFNLGNS